MDARWMDAGACKIGQVHTSPTAPAAVCDSITAAAAGHGESAPPDVGPGNASSLHPCAWVACSIKEVLLWTAWRWLVVIQPAGVERHGHENGLDAATGLEAKGGAPVVHQVELNVPPATHL